MLHRQTRSCKILISVISLSPVQLQLPVRLGNNGHTLQEYHDMIVKAALTLSQGFAQQAFSTFDCPATDCLRA